MVKLFMRFSSSLNQPLLNSFKVVLFILLFLNFFGSISSSNPRRFIRNIYLDSLSTENLTKSKVQNTNIRDTIIQTNSDSLRLVNSHGEEIEGKNFFISPASLFK